VHESPEEIAELQRLLDDSYAHAGAHLRSILSEERRSSAADVCRALVGMRLLTVATVTADGRPLAGPVDGYLIHGSFWFSTGRDAVRARHLAVRPALSATYVPGEQFALSVHGTAELYDLSSEAGAPLRRAMLDHYLPIQGAAFEAWLDRSDALGVRIAADRLFALQLPTDP
jgi:hypothetical protein